MAFQSLSLSIESHTTFALTVTWDLYVNSANSSCFWVRLSIEQKKVEISWDRDENNIQLNSRHFFFWHNLLVCTLHSSKITLVFFPLMFILIISSMFKNKFHSDFSLSSFVWCFFFLVYFHIWPMTMIVDRSWDQGNETSFFFFNSTFLLSFFTDYHRKWYFSSAAEARAADVCWKMLMSSEENEWNDLWFFSSISTFVNSVLGGGRLMLLKIVTSRLQYRSCCWCTRENFDICDICMEFFTGDLSIWINNLHKIKSLRKISCDRCYHVHDDIQKSNDFSTFPQFSAAFSTREKYKCKAGKK